eukprot:2546271-Karenia_brevis.AAC.1
MGYRRHHTAPAVKSGFAKANPKLAERIRISLVGNSFNVVVVAWLLSWRAVAEGLRDEYISFKDLWQQARDLKTDAAVLADLELGMNYNAAMGAVLCEGADHKGSDVRLVSGEMMRT